MGLLGNSVKQPCVETIENPASSARFKNCLDAIHALLLQLIHLLPRFVAGLRNAFELFIEAGASASGNILKVFRSVAACGGKQWPASLQIRTQYLPAANRRTQLEDAIQHIADASDRGYVAVEIRR